MAETAEDRLGFCSCHPAQLISVSQSPLSTDQETAASLHNIGVFSICSYHLLRQRCNSSQIYPLLNLDKATKTHKNLRYIITSLLFFFCPGHFPALLYQRFHVLFSTTRLIKSVLITLPGLLFPPFLLGYSTEYKPSCVLNNVYLGKSLMEFSD